MPAVLELSSPASDLPPVRRLSVNGLVDCITRGAADVAAAPAPSLLQGLIVALAGWLVLALGRGVPWLLPGALSAFVLVAPILATGLYEVARLRGLGRRPGLADALAAWRRGTRPLVRLGLLLAGLGLAWVAGSALLFALFVKTPLAEPAAFLRYVVRGQGDPLFSLWTLAGGLGAAIVFAMTAVSAPLMLERQIGFRRAVLTSIRAVGDNPFVMGLWAALIMVATFVGIATAMLGFILIVPVAGCATWHVYRALVDADALPLRD